MKKRIVAICLVVALAAVAIAGGTMAYLTDTDAKINTFTIGDVNIHIDEWMVKDNEWVEYTDLQHLSPIAQSKAPFNKLVETVNDGSEPAYIRTFITCPAEDYNDLGYGFIVLIKETSIVSFIAVTDLYKSFKQLGDPTYDYTMHYLDKWTDLGKAIVNGKEVYIFMCEHYEAIPAGDSILSLTKVWVYDHVGNAGINERFDVQVFSEAIQSANLTYEEAMKTLNNGKTDLEHAAELFNK